MQKFLQRLFSVSRTTPQMFWDIFLPNKNSGSHGLTDIRGFHPWYFVSHLAPVATHTRLIDHKTIKAGMNPTPAVTFSITPGRLAFPSLEAYHSKVGSNRHSITIRTESLRASTSYAHTRTLPLSHQIGFYQ